MSVSQRRDVGDEARRLEELWSGRFGDEYIARNLAAAQGRDGFWRRVFAGRTIERVLEVGCNVGANLQWIACLTPARHVTGVDINRGALAQLRRTVAGVSGILAPARALPFRAGTFDLVFTAGVLIHQPDTVLPAVIDELVRCSRRYVLCIEYFAETPVEVPYRGESGALFKRDYGRMCADRCPDLALVDRGELHRDEGWDEVTYWLFEKPARR